MRNPIKLFVLPFQAVGAELRQVIWPTPKQLIALLLFTIIVCGIISVVILGLDVVFLELRDAVLNL